jgi:hypothetical protein
MKYYPLPKNNSPISLESNDEFDVAFKTINQFLTNRTSTITVGMYAFNHLIKESGIKEKKGNENDFTTVNYYEFITTDYVKDTLEILKLLNSKFGNINGIITKTENHPLFQYLGNSTNIYLKNELICKIYHYNYRCTPFNDVKPYFFSDSKYELINETDEKGFIRIGTLSVLMMYNLISILKARIDSKAIDKDTYYAMNSQIITMKDYYLKNNKKTLIDDGLFQEFQVRCIGNMETPQMERQKRIKKKIKAGKRFTYNYNPEKDRDRTEGVYRFKNTSGNQINNPKQFKIVENYEKKTKDSDDVKDLEVDMEDGTQQRLKIGGDKHSSKKKKQSKKMKGGNYKKKNYIKL